MDFFTNPWFIGIGGGVFSGLVVTLISREIFSRKDNKEYHQKIVTANHEVLYAIRPSISEKKIPENKIIESVQSATAQKYNIELQDLYKLEELVDILIKEVMDSSFISMETKTNYCMELANLKRTSIKAVDIKKEKFTKNTTESNKYYQYRQRTWTMMSATIGAMTAVMTMIVYLSSKNNFLPSSFSSERILPLLAITLAAVMTVTMTTLLTSIKRQHKEEKETTSKDKFNFWVSRPTKE